MLDGVRIGFVGVITSSRSYFPSGEPWDRISPTLEGVEFLLIIIKAYLPRSSLLRLSASSFPFLSLTSLLRGDPIVELFDRKYYSSNDFIFIL